jgi:hypothetical protein
MWELYLRFQSQYRRFMFYDDDDDDDDDDDEWNACDNISKAH